MNRSNTMAGASKMKKNFIVASLCDNDFGYKIKMALEQGDDFFDTDMACPRIWKAFIIAFIIGEHMKSDAFYRATDGIKFDRHKHTEEYLENGLRVTFEAKLPKELDHDGGSAYYDCNRKVSVQY